MANSKIEVTSYGGFIGGNNANAEMGGAIGLDAETLGGGSIGYNAKSENGGAAGQNANTRNGGAVGFSANATSGGAVGYNANATSGGAIGNKATTTTGGSVGIDAHSAEGGAVGKWANAGDGFAGGKEAFAEDAERTGIDAIQLGTGTNSTPKTMQVYKYQLMDENGMIPSGRIPTAIGEKSTTQQGGAVGIKATSTSGGAIGWGSKTTSGGAIGSQAVSKQGGAIGNDSKANDGGAVGKWANAGDGFAGGKEAFAEDAERTGIDAIQLGTGTNSTPKTLQIYDYELLDANGMIPAERIPTAIGSGALTDDGGAIGLDAETLGGGSIGYNAKSENGGAAGQNANTRDGGAVGFSANATSGGAVGYKAKTTAGGSVGNDANSIEGGAVGRSAYAANGGAVGYWANAGDGFAGGNNAAAEDASGKGIDAIQLGTGKNTTPKTMQVYDKRIVDADGSLTDVGSLSQLQTKTKSNVVSAVNELKSGQSILVIDLTAVTNGYDSIITCTALDQYEAYDAPKKYYISYHPENSVDGSEQYAEFVVSWFGRGGPNEFTQVIRPVSEPDQAVYYRYGDDNNKTMWGDWQKIEYVDKKNFEQLNHAVEECKSTTDFVRGITHKSTIDTCEIMEGKEITAINGMYCIANNPNTRIVVIPAQPKSFYMMKDTVFNAIQKFHLGAKLDANKNMIWCGQIDHHMRLEADLGNTAYIAVTYSNDTPFNITRIAPGYMDKTYVDTDFDQRNIIQKSDNLVHCVVTRFYNLYTRDIYYIDNDTRAMTNMMEYDSTKKYYCNLNVISIQLFDENMAFLKCVSVHNTVINPVADVPGAKYMIAFFQDLRTPLPDIWISEKPLSGYVAPYVINNTCIDTEKLNTKCNTRDFITGYKGMTFVGFGESTIADGEAAVFRRIVKDYFGLAEYQNCGIGGSTVTGGGTNAMWQDTRINAMSPIADYITIMAGTNDTQYQTLGEVSFTNTNTNTFVGAYNVMLSKIYYKYLKPSTGLYSEIDYSGVNQVDTARDIKILIITPSRDYTNESFLTKCIQFEEAIKKIAVMWSLPVADAAGELQVNRANLPRYFYGTDYVHMNTAANKNLAGIVIGKLKSIEVFNA